jgi:hypothetical protein
MVGYLVPRGGTTKVMVLIPSHCKIGDYGFGEIDASLSIIKKVNSEQELLVIKKKSSMMNELNYE